MATEKWIYYYGDEDCKGKYLVGGKGHGLSEMTRMKLPIPTGFVISTRACIAYQQESKFPAGLTEQLTQMATRAQQVSGKNLGDKSRPLLLSVRSGAAISMPGMMDTVLNLGLNDEIVEGMAKTFNERFAYDSYRRFIQMFGDVVMNIKRENFEHVLDQLKESKGVKLDTELDANDLKKAVKGYFAVYQKAVGQPFPTTWEEQLSLAIKAVFESWNNPRAIKYRELNKIPHDLGTAVNVQEMVYGNMGLDCGTGVAFTRHPSTGENARFGEYLPNAQGEDVVAGIRTPKDLEEMKDEFPNCYTQLYEIFELLENHFRDMQDIEFTIENRKLFILQTRNGKRTAAAAVKMAVDMMKSGFIDKKTALLRVTPEQLETLLHPQLDPKAIKGATPLGKGLPASPGAAVGQIVFESETATKFTQEGKKIILVRTETSPEDIQGMAVAEGILTARGGMTSHAAVVARGMNTCCIAGCSDIVVDEHKKVLRVAGQTFAEGDYLCLNGTTGVFYAGKLPVVSASLQGEFGELLKLADEFATMQVMANADTPKDAKIARDFGAVGIGLTRTEHMFFDSSRIFVVRQMILAESPEARAAALAKLLPYQRADFSGIFESMDGLPVVVRLIDPPLHEFLPHEEKEIVELANASSGVTVASLKQQMEGMREFNPMLGFRGCRLGTVYPEINAMQVQAIFEAALQLKARGLNPNPWIEIPLAGNVKEFIPLKRMIKKIAKDTGAEGKINYHIGTMIEVPRAALTANEFAQEADFMSFGTNDLTQMTCGFSRDDAGSFLGEYTKRGIYKIDPFVSIDQEGVGKLMQLCVSLARSVNPKIDIGICGEHGGEPNSVEFCHRTQLNSVSCSPFRVPVARLAAGQAAVKFGQAAAQSIFLQSKL